MTALQQQGAAAKAASRVLAMAGTAKKNEALEAIAAALTARQDEWLAANAEDLSAAAENGVPKTMLDRLKLDEKRLKSLRSQIKRIPPANLLVETVFRECGFEQKSMGENV